MTDDEIRALVREAITRNLGQQSPAPFDQAQGSPDPSTGSGSSRAKSRDERSRGAPGQPAAPPPWRAHASFGRFLVTSGTEEDGACLIEPNVRCNHCGYCQSYGH